MGDTAQSRPARVVRLLRNTSYPTYQLYAQMASKKTAPQDGLRLAALITLHWLAQRLGADVPEELAHLPSGEDYRTAGDACLRSFHISCGFLIDVVSLPGQGIWTLHINEPDLGSDPGNPAQARAAVPGRVIETNVAFRINGQSLDCGFQTIVSDPAETAQKAEVYRLAIVKKLVHHPDFGLKQIVALTPQATEITNQTQLRSFAELCRHPDNQLPNVVFVERDRPQADIAAQLPKLSDLTGSGVPLYAPLLAAKPPAPKPAPAEPFYDIAAFAQHTMGYARTYVLAANLAQQAAKQLHIACSPGDIVVIEPPFLGGKRTTYPPKSSRQRREEFQTHLQKEMMVYPRDKAVTFGNISFLSAAREALMRSTQETVHRSRQLSAEWQQEIARLERQWKDALAKKDQEYEALRVKLDRQKEYITQLEREKDDLALKHEEQEGRWQAALAEEQKVVAHLKRKLSQPRALKDIPSWVEKNFADRLVLLSPAVEMLADKSLYADAGLICDALDFLATDYWANRYERITIEEMKTLCSQKYGRPFEIKPIGEATIDRYPKEYRVKYIFPGDARRREVDLNTHLCVGNDAEVLIRIYFFHDDARRLIVVGSLPRHLSTINC